ncbi:hypothetical protein [Helicobacter pullorum]|uniref:hypothetical protein n=1 Tax=Helicobacter pullorum TaxID=35818 RepID=UPI000816836A|nr:hypothetical protein [Helicobacter pullorum]OCR13874.1 hypothetical protein BA916_07745 [Helicobacter pullorum]
MQKHLKENGKQNIILLGGSNSVMVNGLQKGIREGIAKLNEGKDEKEQLEFYNFGLGSSISFQNLYELLRERNQEILKNTQLIITESNINEIANHHGYSKIPLETIIRSIEWLYEKLHSLKKKVLILLLPYMNPSFINQQIIDNAHRDCANRYGFNLIDMQTTYKKDNLWNFYGCWGAHQMASLMKTLGKNITMNFNNFLPPNNLLMASNLPQFEILSPENMELLVGDIEKKELKNSAFCENIFRIANNTKLQFPQKYQGFHLIGLHAWNEGKPKSGSVYNTYSSIIIFNTQQTLIKSSSLIRLFNTINMDFIIDGKTFIEFNSQSLPLTELSEAVIITQDTQILNYFDMVDLLLAKEGKWDYTIPDNNETIIIEAKYNFNHLIPDIKLYKEIIDEYCAKMDPIKLAPLQNQLTQVKSQLTSKSQELESLKFQYDSKIKELQVNLKTTQDSLSSLPIKKQTLEIKNLESDLKIKELKAKQIEKELGYSYNVLEELDLKKQELIKVKQQLDSTKKQLESKNTGLESNLNYPIFKGNLSYLNTMTSAKSRIHNHLSYKLGKAMIENSKSILGYIRMPYVLSYIKEQHNKEQQQYQEQIKKNPNLKLPKLESYKDYKEALKEKECFTYKLGEAFIRANTLKSKNNINNNTNNISGGGGKI